MMLKRFFHVLLLCVVLEKFLLVQSHRVEELTDSNFEEKVKNGKWLVVFYAPWCGHCQKIKPVLEEVSRLYFKDEIRIGKVDATQHTGLKAKYEVGGYPTLEYFEEGEIAAPFTGGRDIDSIRMFGERMMSPMLRPFDDIPKMKRWLETGSRERNIQKEPVSFVYAHGGQVDPAVEELAKQVRSYQFMASCERASCLEMLCGNGGCEENKDSTKDLLIRYEPEQPVAIFQGDMQNVTEMQIWMTEQSIAVFSEIGLHNFGLYTQQEGKYVVMGAVNPDRITESGKFVRKLKKIANGQSATLSKPVLSKFLFVMIDGKYWKGFLEDYNVVFEELPRVVVMDFPNKQFFENQTMPIEQLLQAVHDAQIAPQSSSGWLITVKRLWRAFVKNLPMSAILGGFILIVFIMFLYLMCFSEFEEEILPPSEEPTQSLSTKKQQ